MGIAKQKKGMLWLGTSGIVLPGTKLSFPEAFQHKSRLHYYGSLLPSVEINSCFYKVPMRSTFEKWSQDVPAAFRFTLKLWREITHVKELKFKQDDIDTFLKASRGIGQKKGCLLVQFPGKITLDYYNQVEEILKRLILTGEENTWRIAIEFRNSSWYTGETMELLDEYGASLVLHDIPKAKNTMTNKRAEFVYLRFHGPAGDYRGSYPDTQLREQADKINAWLQEGKDVYAYFNNTMGSALENVLALKAMSGK